jgi:hypothetical protein
MLSVQRKKYEKREEEILNTGLEYKKNCFRLRYWILYGSHFISCAVFFYKDPFLMTKVLYEPPVKQELYWANTD